jgi:hypothetical protein
LVFNLLVKTIFVRTNRPRLKRTASGSVGGEDDRMREVSEDDRMREVRRRGRRFVMRMGR